MTAFEDCYKSFWTLQGSVSVSMSVYQTPFCFVCTHLASGEKYGDHRKRNADVSDIHRRTQFHPHSLSATRLPRSIRDHEYGFIFIVAHSKIQPFLNKF